MNRRFVIASAACTPLLLTGCDDDDDDKKKKAEKKARKKKKARDKFLYGKDGRLTPDIRLTCTALALALGALAWWRAQHA